LHCPSCQAEDTKVIDSRALAGGLSIRRRRKCEVCEKRFTTYEHFEAEIPAIVKQDGRRESFDPEKIMKGLTKACQKRPISSDQLHQLIDSTQKTLCDRGTKEVPSSLVGEIVMDALYRLDPVSYVRFASFYWNFNDIDGFVKTLQNTLKTLDQSKGQSSDCIDDTH
jgi:transcriptional repressor NrdR